MAFRIRFLPDQRELVLDEPLELSLAAARCDIWLEQPCGSRTVCGQCRVRFSRGAVPTTPADRRMVAPDDLAAGWRLGCQLTLASSCDIEVPQRCRAVAPKSFGPEALPVRLNEPQVPSDLAVRGETWLGVAVDLGSTTLAGALVDLQDGRVVATTSRLNPQMRFGADVISRIHFAQEHDGGNAQLHHVLVRAVGEMLTELSVQTGLPPGRIVAVTCVGNATMTHSAVGADVTPLGQAPYMGSFVAEQEMPATALGWHLHPGTRVRFVPMIGSHVGGDTVAGILACEIDRSTGWRLLVDLGTNAEVVVGSRHRILATSTAAGPAFDGAIITCGMRAEPGAIDAVRIRPSGELVVSTIASRPPAGLCGSGLVDAVAELLVARVIEASGYLRSRTECESLGVPVRLLDRIVESSTGDRAVHLAGDVRVTAQDVRQLQLVKGSIAAGISMLTGRLRLSPRDLDEVLVSGTFGAFLRKASLLAIGLVPRVDPQRVHFVANAAGAGARLILVDGQSRRRAIDAARRAEYVELAGDPDYEAAFCAGIPFPEPDAGDGSGGRP
jgi:uncharacterized 2Fe-2S/4Fe-4S cluster protein (DUF4445 family)